MKKEEKIFEGITNINDDLIEEAKKVKTKRNKYKWKRWMTIAACLFILLGLGPLIFTNKNNDSNNGDFKNTQIIPISYPKAYAFDDFEAKKIPMTKVL